MIKRSLLGLILCLILTHSVWAGSSTMGTSVKSFEKYYATGAGIGYWCGFLIREQRSALIDNAMLSKQGLLYQLDDFKQTKSAKAKKASGVETSELDRSQRVKETVGHTFQSLAEARFENPGVSAPKSSISNATFSDASLTLEE